MRKLLLITMHSILLLLLTIPAAGRQRTKVPKADRRITYRPVEPHVNQVVTFESLNFVTQSVDWNFGDGTVITGGSRTVTHKFREAGAYRVTAKDTPIAHTPVTTVVTILAENRSITVSSTRVRTGQRVTVTAHNFRDPFVRWDFGDGSQEVGGHSITHSYRRTGRYIITGKEDCADCPETFTANVTVEGIDDQVGLEFLQVAFANGKGYKVVPKNWKNIKAVLRMKLEGTGTLAGYWEVDGRPFEFFSRMVSQGELAEIATGGAPGLPTMDPVHTLTLRLTKPADVQATFPTLKYYVLPHELTIDIQTPPDGFVAKEDEIPLFSWKEARGAVTYQVAFSNGLFAFLSDEFTVAWNDAGAETSYTPGDSIWKTIKRNRWTYWQVRALSGSGEVVAESAVHEIKIVIAEAEIGIHKVTDLDGKEIDTGVGGAILSASDHILMHGSMEYKGDSKYMVLQVYVDDRLTDRLLFRDVKKGRRYDFETSIANWSGSSRVVFNVLKTSSPAVIVGIKELWIKKK